MLFIFAHFGICHISQKRTECRLIKSLYSASRLIIGKLNLFGLTLVAQGDHVITIIALCYNYFIMQYSQCRRMPERSDSERGNNWDGYNFREIIERGY